jgi:hypothetical protein
VALLGRALALYREHRPEHYVVLVLAPPALDWALSPFLALLPIPDRVQTLACAALSPGLYLLPVAAYFLLVYLDFAHPVVRAPLLRRILTYNHLGRPSLEIFAPQVLFCSLVVTPSTPTILAFQVALWLHIYTEGAEAHAAGTFPDFPWLWHQARHGYMPFTVTFLLAAGHFFPGSHVPTLA